MSGIIGCIDSLTEENTGFKSITHNNPVNSLTQCVQKVKELSAGFCGDKPCEFLMYRNKTPADIAKEAQALYLMNDTQQHDKGVLLYNKLWGSLTHLERQTQLSSPQQFMFGYPPVYISPQSNTRRIALDFIWGFNNLKNIPVVPFVEGECWTGNEDVKSKQPVNIGTYKRGDIKCTNRAVYIIPENNGANDRETIAEMQKTLKKKVDERVKNIKKTAETDVINELALVDIASKNTTVERFQGNNIIEGIDTTLSYPNAAANALVDIPARQNATERTAELDALHAEYEKLKVQQQKYEDYANLLTTLKTEHTSTKGLKEAQLTAAQTDYTTFRRLWTTAKEKERLVDKIMSLLGIIILLVAGMCFSIIMYYISGVRKTIKQETGIFDTPKVSNANKKAIMDIFS